MFSIVQRGNAQIANVYVCVSTDSKPVDAGNGDVVVELDTSSVYLFDKGGAQWRAFVAGGGTDVSDTTATAADVLSPAAFYLADGTKTTGTIVTYDGSVS